MSGRLYPAGRVAGLWAAGCGVGLAGAALAAGAGMIYLPHNLFAPEKRTLTFEPYPFGEVPFTVWVEGRQSVPIAQNRTNQGSH